MNYKFCKINFGPQHPSAHGVLRLILETHNEIINQIEIHIGLLHRGTEKLMELKNIINILPYMDRLDYICSMVQEYTYSLVCEKISLFTFKNKCLIYFRILFCELTRLLNHIFALTTHALDIGAVTPFLWLFDEREKLLEFYERFSGARMHANFLEPFSYKYFNIIWKLGFWSDLNIFISQFIFRLNEVEELLTSNRIWKHRLINVGIITYKQAKDFGLTGVLLRSTGFDFDLRRNKTMLEYSMLKFKIVKGYNGDSYDRYLMRIEEMRQSLRILKYIIKFYYKKIINKSFIYFNKYIAMNFYKSNTFDITKNMEYIIKHFCLYKNKKLSYTFVKSTYTSVESPKGEFGIYILPKNNKITRCRIRTPGLTHLQIINHIARGCMIADLSAILGTLDLVFGDIDK